MKKENAITWMLYSYSKEAWRQMIHDCQKAKEFILFEQFLFDDIKFGIGKIFLDVLERKQREGVQVYLLCDVYGSVSLYFSGRLKKLRSLGMKIIVHDVTPGWYMSTKKTLFRDHRKVMVVDNNVAYVGGVVIVDRAIHWRDAHARFTGSVVLDIAQEFWQTWMHCGGEICLSFPLFEQKSSDFQVLIQDNILQRKEIFAHFIRKILLAKTSIKIATPYFSPPRQMWMALRDAMSRGVEISLVIPEKSEFFHADMVAKSYINAMIKENCYIFTYPDNLMHSKLFIVDDQFASIGSCNFDIFSFTISHELNVASTHIPFVKDVVNEFEQTAYQCAVMTQSHWSRRLRKEKVFSNMFKILRPFV